MGATSAVIDEVQKILRERLCTCGLPPQIFGLEQERRHLYDLINRTAALGESNSVIIVGPRGSGKTMLLGSILKELRETKAFTGNLLQVHLNGLVETNDCVALKEITRQLQLENTLGDRVFGSFAETLQFLLDALKSGGQQSKPVLFVLEEFDLFANHKNQVLLYNLLDISQSAQTPVCIVGLTCRLDVIELLEKRVKSRFSHRQIHLFNKLDLNTYAELFQSYLQLPDDFFDKKYRKEWNLNIKDLCQQPAMLDVLKKQHAMTKDIRSLQQLMLLPVCQLDESHPHLTAASFVNSTRHLKHDSKAAMLHGLSVLELCLTIAMNHLMQTYCEEPFNFEMVYSEYQKFSQRHSSMQLFDKAVVMKAFEHLCALELVQPTDGSASKVQKEYRLMTLLIDPSQVTEALLKYPNCPTDIKQWAYSAVA